MIDEVKKRRMEVKSDEIAGPFLNLPLAQLASVREVLDRHGTRYDRPPTGDTPTAQSSE